MAIKGKTKSRSRRVVAVPPRPPLYVRKPPFWQRRIFWVGVGVLVVAGILTVVVLNMQSNHRKHVKALTLTAVGQFQNAIEKTFPDDAQKAPGTSTWQLYPSLATDLTDVESGKLTGSAAGSKATNLQKSAKTTGDAIDALKIDVIPEDSIYGEVASVQGKGATRLVMNDAKALIVQSYRVYGSIGSLMQQAATTTDATARKALVDDARQLLIQAQTLFSRGFSKITNVRSQLAPPTPANFQPGQPGTLGG
jgi:hypothetical protein